MSRTVIVVCAHKQDVCLATPPYMPIHVGKALSTRDLGYVGDDTGDNISAKNPNYCEVTALYWAWKNLKDYDYIGLNHYRRYFDFDDSTICNIKAVKTAEFFGKPHPAPDFDALFQRYDIVIAKPNIYTHNLYSDYARCHVESDFQVLRQVVRELYPDYGAAFDRVFFHNSRLSHYGMFVMPRALFERYAQWTFDVLFETERRITMHTDPVQSRVMGYMNERLLNVFVVHNALRACYKSVLFVDDNIVCRSPREYLHYKYESELCFGFRHLFGLCPTEKSAVKR